MAINSSIVLKKEQETNTHTVHTLSFVFRMLCHNSQVASSNYCSRMCVGAPCFQLLSLPLSHTFRFQHEFSAYRLYLLTRLYFYFDAPTLPSAKDFNKQSFLLNCAGTTFICCLFHLCCIRTYTLMLLIPSA